MKKSHIVMILGLLLFTVPLFAQASVDPEDDFYTYATGWKLKGYIQQLPQLKPYPLNVIKDIIEFVAEKGDAQDAADAKKEYERIFNKPWNVGIAVTGLETVQKSSKNSDIDNTGEITFDPQIYGDIPLGKLISLGYYMGVHGTQKGIAESSLCPYYQNSDNDTYDDPTSISSYELNMDANMIVAAGKKNLYATAGLNRTGFGPFLHSDVILNPSAFHAPAFTFVYDGDIVDFTQYLAGAGAQKNNGSDTYLPDKFFAMHSIRFSLFSPKISLTYYEMMVFGKRFDPSYLIPAPYMMIQGISGTSDNLQMGLLLEYIPIQCLEWATNLMVDDISANDVVKLNFDTKIRTAIQTGLLYSPLDSTFKMISLDYMLVTPYTYAHWEYCDESTRDFDGKTYNYQNYTNRGVSMGSSIPPNSDKVTCNIVMRPVKGLKLTTETSLTRHANEYESLTDDEKKRINDDNHDSTTGVIYSTDGSISTQQMYDSDGKHIDTAWEHLNFLTQDHVMYVAQACITVEYTFPRCKIGTFSATAGYTFEYIRNVGVDQPMLDGTYATWQEAYDNWVANLHDVYNNYLKFGVKYSY